MARWTAYSQMGEPVSEKIFKTNPERLDYLLTSIHNREVALPDFQRDFVWDPAATEELIESICQNYPAGSLLKIRNGAGFQFAPRTFAGAPPLDGHSPSYLVLDGQQRLTSLYQALYGAGDYRYLMCLGSLLEGSDLEDSVFYVTKRNFARWYAAIEQQAKELTLPLSVLFTGEGKFEGWLDAVVEIRQGAPEEMRDLKVSLRQIKEDWLKSLEQYEFPVVELADGTTPDAVCTIFETLNRTGVKLSVFDLLTARFWAEDVRLRDLWETAQSDHQIISEFEIDPYTLLQAVALRAPKGAPSCKRGDVLKLSAEDIRLTWDSTVMGLAQFLKLLREDCGVILPKLLPYSTMLVTGAAAMAETAGEVGPKVGAIREKMKRWFFCASLSQAYDNAANSRAAREYQELREWFGEGPTPQVVAEFWFDPSILDSTTSRQRAVYRACIALILRGRALDFHTREKITAKLVWDEGIDDHHLFPAAYLRDNRPDIGAIQRDCVLNRTYIDKITNIRIGRRAPSDYLAEVAAEMGESKLDQILASHLLPTGADSALRLDDFDDLMEHRRTALTEAIIAATGVDLS